MKIVTAYSEDFTLMKDNLVNSTEHKVYAYKLKEQKDNARFIKRCHYKLDFIRRALNRSKEDVVWIDADCVTRELDNPLRGCDIAVTLRRRAEKDEYYNYSGLLNAGVIFFKNNHNSRRFIDLWEHNLPKGEHKTDQEALNITCGINGFTTAGDVLHNAGAMIRVLSCSKYNFFYFPEDPKDAKVLHFKGDVRHYMQDYEI